MATILTSTATTSDPSSSSKVIEIDDDNDNDDSSAIDDEQLEEYRDMVEQLGGFPDKVKINSLSMVAEDHADSKSSARQIYNVIRARLVSPSSPSDTLLPLVYAIDSILKNVKGQYVPIIELDAHTWLPVVLQRLPEVQKQKLRKVYQTWVDLKLFKEERLRDMGRCFEGSSGLSSTAAVASSSSLATIAGSSSASSALASRLGTEMVAGIARTADGRLVLSPVLRRAMEEILDQLQSDMDNELDKVSLERLSYLNPELLGNIKQTAQENLNSNATATSPTNGAGSAATSTSTLPSYFVETRSDDEIQRSKAWSDLKLSFPAESDAILRSIKDAVDREQPKWDGSHLYTQREATAWTRVLASALATSSHLRSATERLQQQKSHMQQSPSSSGGPNRLGGPFRGGAYSQMGGAGTGYSAVDKSLFTNRGVKERNDTVIGLLYEVGLPFVSSVDGRRFATQQELSSHLDALFRRNQLEKSIARTEERGWFVTDIVWTFETSKGDADNMGLTSTMTGTGEFDMNADGARGVTSTSDDGYDPATSTHPADETRDRCVVCGINFKMVFDNDDGAYKYTNCREIEMLNDDAADVESEPVLVHVTCWRGLGSPDVLTADQAIQETLHHYSY